jgi:hypothetical protein
MYKQSTSPLLNPVPLENVSRLPVEVIRGSKSERITAPWQPDRGSAGAAGGARTEMASSSGSNETRE